MAGRRWPTESKEHISSEFLIINTHTHNMLSSNLKLSLHPQYCIPPAWHTHPGVNTQLHCGWHHLLLPLQAGRSWQHWQWHQSPVEWCLPSIARPSYLEWGRQRKGKAAWTEGRALRLIWGLDILKTTSKTCLYLSTYQYVEWWHCRICSMHTILTVPWQ